MNYEIHELALLFPDLSEKEKHELADDIRANGLLEAVTLHEGKILDGRNRYEQCAVAGVECRTVELPPGKDPVRFVLSKNSNRRHMDESQRAMVAAKIANMPHGGDYRGANWPI